MVPGSVSFWLNAFAGAPQLSGCCEQGVLLRMAQYAQYAIQTDDGAGDNAFPITLAWLQALGIQAIGVSGPGSTEWYKPFRHPLKFSGRLRELWRNGDDVLYAVPQLTKSLVHAVRKGDLVAARPTNGVDIEPLLPYIAALRNETYPETTTAWESNDLAHIQARLRHGDVLSVQIANHFGWRATSKGKPLRIDEDGLGFMAIDPGCDGQCNVDLEFTGGLEGKFTAVLSSISVVGGLLLLVGSKLIRFRLAPA